MSILGLGKDSLVYGLGGMSLRLLSIMLLPVFTNHLSPSEYGVLAMLATMVAVLQPVFNLGCGASMGPLYFESNSARDKAVVVWSTFALHACAVVVMLVVTYAMAPWLAELLRIGADKVEFLELAIAGCAIAVLSSGLMQWLQFERRLTAYLLATLVGAAIGSLLSIVMVVWMNAGVAGVLWGQLAGSLIALFVAGWNLLRFAPPTMLLSVMKRLLRSGLPLVPSFAFLFVLNHSNRYFLESFEGLSVVGVYSIGFNLGAATGIVVSAITTAWYPFFMRYMPDPRAGEEVFARVARYYVLLIGFLCLGMALFSDTVVAILVHESYRGAAGTIALIALAHGIQGMFNLFLPGLYFLKEVQYVSLVQGAAALLALPLNYFLVRWLGITGAGLGVVAGSILMVAFTLLWNIYRRQVYPNIPYEWIKIFRICLLLVSIYGVYVAAKVSFAVEPVYWAVGLSILAAVLLYRTLDARERQIIGRRIGL